MNVIAYPHIQGRGGVESVPDSLLDAVSSNLVMPSLSTTGLYDMLSISLSLGLVLV